MRSFYFIGLLLWASVTLHANTQGLDQTHLVSHAPADLSDVSATSDFSFTFDLDIMQKSVHQHTVILKQKSPKHQRVKGNITFPDTRTVRFSPTEPLQKGIYQLHLKPLKLLKEDTSPFEPKTWWQKAVVWLCSLFYEDVTECPLCHAVCHIDNTLRTRPVSYRFTVNEQAPKVVSLELNTTSVVLSEHNSTAIKVTASYDNNTSEDVTAKATYSSSDNAVDADKGIITSHAEGSAIVTVSYGGKSAALQVEVYEMIDGHLLPHEPQDPDATLLGVDANNNGIRDDVERWIYKEMPTYDHPEMERAVSMQEAKAYQMTLIDPTNKDNKVLEAMDRAGDCWGYYVDITHFPFKYWEEFRHKLKDKQFNTKERLKTYFDYNRNLGAHVITLQTSTVDACDVNLDQLP